MSYPCPLLYHQNHYYPLNQTDHDHPLGVAVAWEYLSYSKVLLARKWQQCHVSSYEGEVSIGWSLLLTELYRSYSSSRKWGLYKVWNGSDAMDTGFRSNLRIRRWESWPIVNGTLLGILPYGFLHRAVAERGPMISPDPHSYLARLPGPLWGAFVPADGLGGMVGLLILFLIFSYKWVPSHVCMKSPILMGSCRICILGH